MGGSQLQEGDGSRKWEEVQNRQGAIMCIYSQEEEKLYMAEAYHLRGEKRVEGGQVQGDPTILVLVLKVWHPKKCLSCTQVSHDSWSSQERNKEENRAWTQTEEQIKAVLEQRSAGGKLDE